MKHLLPTALLLAVGCLGAAAQSVVFVDRSANTRKFATDRIKDITFIKVDAPAPETVIFTSLKAAPYSSGGYVDLTLTSDDGTSLDMYVCGPKDALYLNDGVYSVDPSNNPMTVDSDPGYSWVTRGGEKTAITSGQMNVSRTEATYVITTAFTLADETEFDSTFTGEIPNYSPYLMLTASDAKSVDINDRKPGEFYLRLNDPDWTFEMVLDLFAAADAETLPAGTYTFANTQNEGTFDAKTGIDIYKPASNPHAADGSKVTVSYEGENAIIDMDLNLSDGRHATVTFKGKISY